MSTLRFLNKYKKNSRRLTGTSDDLVNLILEDLATLAVREVDFLLEENKKDLERMDPPTRCMTDSYLLMPESKELPPKSDR